MPNEIPSIEVFEVHAFSHHNSGGNPAGVVLHAEALSHDQKQAIAASAGYSETAFVLPSRQATVRLEFFTPNRQIADCGHATVAAFSLLRDRGMVALGDASKEILDGVRAIRIEPHAISMQQAAPRFSAPLDTATLQPWLQALQPDAQASADAMLAAPAQVGSTGGRFLLLPLAELATLRALQPDLRQLEWLSEEADVIGVYAFVCTPNADTWAMARMFAPRYGIAEESATGIAAGALGCWLRRERNAPAEGFWLAQGDVMPVPTPSRLHVRFGSDDTAAPDTITADTAVPWVGGSARQLASRFCAIA